jgi:hypothetical protein
MAPVDVALAGRIWQILVEECLANTEWRDPFVHYVVDRSQNSRILGDAIEFTCPGGLGTFHCTRDCRDMRVHPSPTEECFPEMLERIRRANERLGHLEAERSE